MEENVLDDIYSWGNHHPTALNGLTALSTTKEPLLWTALPARKLTFSDALGMAIALVLLFLTTLLLLLSRLPILLFIALFTGGAFLAIVIEFWKEEQKRKHTFYGITGSTVLIKSPNQPLQHYPIQQLSSLALAKNDIHHIVFSEGHYQQETLLAQVPESQYVFQLLDSLHQQQVSS